MRMIATAALALSLGMSTMAEAAEDPSVEAFEQGQQAAWNAGDAATYAATFALDADLVTASGDHATGAAQAASLLADGFRTVYANSRLALTVSKVRPLAPGLIWAGLEWTLSGSTLLGEQRGVEIQLLHRDGGRWMILSQQDTPRSGTTPMPNTAVAAPVPPAPASTTPATPPTPRRCILARAGGACLIYGKPKPAGG